MTNLVPPSEIEEIVGAKRHAWKHLARVVSSEGTCYILHSQQCVDSGIDLRDCEYSKALDLGLHSNAWRGSLDKTVAVLIVADTGLRPVWAIA